MNHTNRFIGLMLSGLVLLSGWTACQRGSGSDSAEENVVNHSEHMLDDTGYEWSTEAEVVTLDEGETAAILQFEEDSYDFGVVTEGEKVEYEYVFTNEGNAPLIVGQVTASCGCTTPEYSRKPIAPGDTGSIKVVFDSKGEVGRHHKIVTVQTNAKGEVGLLHLRGEVQSKR